VTHSKNNISKPNVFNDNTTRLFWSSQFPPLQILCVLPNLSRIEIGDKL